MTPGCTLSILVARTDIPYMLSTIPHLVRSCRFQFSKRILVVDSAPLGNAYRDRPGVGTLDQLYACCTQLLSDGVVDKFIDIDYSKNYRNRVYKKHFGKSMWETHNFRGYPILGSIFSIEETESDYIVHFDSDMLFHQQSDYNWIEEGIKLLQKHQDVISVSPLSGPPTENGNLIQQTEVGELYEHDERGFYRFKTFTSRVFLIDRKRFDLLLPLQIKLPVKSRIKGYLTRKSLLPPWEDMVGNRLEKTLYFRVDLDSPKAWTIHPNLRSPEFFEALSDIIKKIEAGWYPSGQGGYYDLKLELWLDSHMS